MGLRVPGIHVKREQFLRKELQSKCTPEVIEKAVSSTPLRAGIPQDLVNCIADEVIQYERVCVSGISAALGMPGGVAMAATTPADIVQYYGYMLRATQKLMYLYGFPCPMYKTRTERKFHELSYQFFMCVMAGCYCVYSQKRIDMH